MSDVLTHLNRAIRAHATGSLEEAKYFYKKTLVEDPQNATALGWLGSIEAQHKNYDIAKDLLLKALAQEKNNKDFLLNYANLLFEKRQFCDAVKYYQKAIRQQPNDPISFANLAACYNEQSQPLLGLRAADQSIQLKPDYAEAWNNRGNALHDLKRYEEAITHYDKALSLKPDHHQAWIDKGVTLCKLKRFDDAITHYDKALSLKPDHHQAWTDKGVALHELKRYEEAITHYDKALSLKPDHHHAWSNKGNTLHELKQYEEAIAHYDKALSLKPDNAKAWSNKGVTLHVLKRLDEAIAHYDKALSLKPDNAKAWSNKGVTLHELKRLDEAIAHHDKALSLKPDYHDASWNKSLSLLLQGDFENGLLLYESRWTSEKISEIAGKRFFDGPSWLGAESIQDKTILLYGEQGFGDFIQFCRYAKKVADLGAKVILEAPRPLAGLMENLEGVSQLVIKGEKLPFFDYQCPLLSLPLAFKTNLDTIPNPSGYINLVNHPDKIMEWKERLGLKSKLRVGLVWSGNPNHENDHNRSILLWDILPFLPNQYEYISLQKEVRGIDNSTLDSNPHILNFASHLNDFLDTAALIDNLDLVISVDTSVAHLSGALGKKTLLLLPNVPDWRWLLDRVDSPWYPSMKLYRKTFISDWKSVLDRVKLDLSSNLS
jgi:tetratricopeptide (TPR) repeat protein